MDTIEVAAGMVKRHKEMAEHIEDDELWFAYLMEIEDLMGEAFAEGRSPSLDEIAGRLLWRASCEWDV